MKYLIFLAAMTLFFPIACGCATVKTAPTAEIHTQSAYDLYVCGYLTDFDKYSKTLQCAPFEVYLEKFKEITGKNPGVKAPQSL